MSELRPQIYANEFIYIIYILKVHSLSKDQTPQHVESDNIFIVCQCHIIGNERRKAIAKKRKKKKTTVV